MILSLIIPTDCYPLRFTYWGHHFYLSGNVWKYFHFCCNWCVVQIIHFFSRMVSFNWDTYPLIKSHHFNMIFWHRLFHSIILTLKRKKNIYVWILQLKPFHSAEKLNWKWGTPVHPLSETHGQSCIHIYNDLEPTDFFFTFTIIHWSYQSLLIFIRNLPVYFQVSKQKHTKSIKFDVQEY